MCRDAAVDGGLKRRSRAVMLHGDPAEPAVHVDNHIVYSFHPTKCMFSSGSAFSDGSFVTAAGNITEKLRLAKLDCRGQTVVDLYAGAITLLTEVPESARDRVLCAAVPGACRRSARARLRVE